MDQFKRITPNDHLTTYWILVGIISIASILYVGGIRKNLPFIPEVDEAETVTPAIHVAASGDLNPHWFGYPGSTVIYPLAALYHIWNVAVYHAPLLQPDPSLQVRFENNPAEF